MTKTIIAIGSHNPVKKHAAEILTKYGDFLYETASVESGISDQPMSREQTAQGAMNRAKNALQAVPNAAYGIGLEGGCRDENGTLYCIAVCAIADAKGKIHLGESAAFPLPNKIRELILAGKELGHATDQVFHEHNSKQKQGSIGLLSKNIVTRTTYYEQAVVCAFLPFLNKEIYN